MNLDFKMSEMNLENVNRIITRSIRRKKDKVYLEFLLSFRWNEYESKIINFNFIHFLLCAEINLFKTYPP